MDQKIFHTVRGYELLEKHSRPLTSALEDYMEMIYRRIQRDGYIKVNALASELNVKPSSASKMIVKLTQTGLINYEKYGMIQLTEKGREMGRYLLWRHEVVNRFFELITQSKSAAIFAETEMTEHLLSKQTVECLEKLVRYFDRDQDRLEELKKYLAGSE